MRHLAATTGWYKVVASCAALGCAWVTAQGCSADGSGDALQEPTVLESPTEGAHLPPPSSTSQPAGDAGKPADAGKDAAKDAGPPPAVPGTPCTKVDEIFKKKCGVCGEHSAICIAHDGGGSRWSDYSLCTGELASGCLPGTTQTEPCGNCGTRTRTCTTYCAWTIGACTGEPASSCAPGIVELSTAGCTAAETYRQRTCKSDCTWNPFSASCSPPPATVVVPPTVGGVSSTVAILSSLATAGRILGTCPSASITPTVPTPYQYITVENPHAKTATVSIYNSLAPGGVVYKTVLAAYDGATPPADDTQRRACVKGVASYGTAALTGDSNFASLDVSRVVTIPAGGSVVVYVGAYYAYDPLNPSKTTGPVKLNVRTETLN